MIIAIGIKNNISLLPLIKTSSSAGLTNQACKPVAAAEITIINKAKIILILWLIKYWNTILEVTDCFFSEDIKKFVKV